MAAGASTATPPVLTAGTASAHFDFEVWQKNVEHPFYDKLRFIKNIAEKDRLYNKLHVRKTERLGVQSLSNTAVGTGLTYEDPAPSEATLTPSTSYCGIAWSDDEESQVDFQIDAEMATSMEQALAESVEETGLDLWTSITNAIGSGAYNVDAAGFRAALTHLASNTYTNAMPGSSDIFGIFHVSQYGNLMAIPEFANADIRGENGSVHVDGVLRTNNGVKTFLSSQIDTGSGYAAGGVWHKSAFAISWNKRTKAYKEQVELQHRVILRNQYGVGIIHNARALLIKTASALPATP